jgi:hypothetical protein
MPRRKRPDSGAAALAAALQGRPVVTGSEILALVPALPAGRMTAFLARIGWRKLGSPYTSGLWPVAGGWSAVYVPWDTGTAEGFLLAHDLRGSDRRR